MTQEKLGRILHSDLTICDIVEKETVFSDACLREAEPIKFFCQRKSCWCERNKKGVIKGERFPSDDGNEPTTSRFLMQMRL